MCPPFPAFFVFFSLLPLAFFLGSVSVPWFPATASCTPPPPSPRCFVFCCSFCLLSLFPSAVCFFWGVASAPRLCCAVPSRPATLCAVLFLLVVCVPLLWCALRWRWCCPPPPPPPPGRHLSAWACTARQCPVASGLPVNLGAFHGEWVYQHKHRPRWPALPPSFLPTSRSAIRRSVPYPQARQPAIRRYNCPSPSTLVGQAATRGCNCPTSSTLARQSALRRCRTPPNPLPPSSCSVHVDSGLLVCDELNNARPHPWD